MTSIKRHADVKIVGKDTILVAIYENNKRTWFGEYFEWERSGQPGTNDEGFKFHIECLAERALENVLVRVGLATPAEIEELHEIAEYEEWTERDYEMDHVNRCGGRSARF